MIYVEDHGKPMAPAGLKGKLTVLNGAEKSEAALVAAGDTPEAKGVKLARSGKGGGGPGHAGGQGDHVRFTVR